MWQDWWYVISNIRLQRIIVFVLLILSLLTIHFGENPEMLWRGPCDKKPKPLANSPVSELKADAPDPIKPQMTAALGDTLIMVSQETLS